MYLKKILCSEHNSNYNQYRKSKFYKEHKNIIISENKL